MTLHTHPEHKLQWNLLHNAIDFVRSGVEAYFGTHEQPLPPLVAFGVPPLDDSEELSLEEVDATPRPDHAYKYAVLHLHAGCLLLFKERLRKEHECLIYQKIDGNVVDPEKRPKTVDFDQALGRLTTWTGVQLDSTERQLLRTLQRLRNDFEHFEINLDKRQAEAVVTGIVEFAYRLLRDELETKLEEEISTNSWQHVSQLRTIAERMKQEYTEDWQRRAEAYSAMSDDELREIAEEHAYHPKHNPTTDDPIWCQNCDTESVYVVDRDLLVCTNTECRGVFETDDCLRCGRPIFSGSTYCDDCEGYIDHQMSKD